MEPLDRLYRVLGRDRPRCIPPADLVKNSSIKVPPKKISPFPTLWIFSFAFSAGGGKSFVTGNDASVDCYESGKTPLRRYARSTINQVCAVIGMPFVRLFYAR